MCEETAGVCYEGVCQNGTCICNENYRQSGDLSINSKNCHVNVTIQKSLWLASSIITLVTLLSTICCLIIIKRETHVGETYIGADVAITILFSLGEITGWSQLLLKPFSKGGSLIMISIAMERRKKQWKIWWFRLQPILISITFMACFSPIAMLLTADVQQKQIFIQLFYLLQGICLFFLAFNAIQSLYLVRRDLKLAAKLSTENPSKQQQLSTIPSTSVYDRLLKRANSTLIITIGFTSTILPTLFTLGTVPAASDFSYIILPILVSTFTFWEWRYLYHSFWLSYRLRWLERKWELSSSKGGGGVAIRAINEDEDEFMDNSNGQTNNNGQGKSSPYLSKLRRKQRAKKNWGVLKGLKAKTVQEMTAVTEGEYEGTYAVTNMGSNEE